MEELLEGMMLGTPDGGFLDYSDERITSEGYVSHRSQKFHRPRVQFLPTHATGRKLSRVLGMERFTAYTKAVCVRNPFDQIVSFFWWRLEAYPKTQRIVERLPMRAIRIWFAVWFIVGYGKIRSLSFTQQLVVDGKLPSMCIIRFESLESDIRALLGELGIPVKDFVLSRRKSTQRVRTEVYQDYYCGALLRAVSRLRADDLRQFNYSWEPKVLSR